MDEILLMQKMTDSQKLMFQSEMSRVRKDPMVGVLITFFLGGFGGHQFYLGKVGLGLLYFFFFWTLIPGLVAFVELFLISGRIRRYNEERASEIAAKLMVLSTSAANDQAKSAAVA